MLSERTKEQFLQGLRLGFAGSQADLERWQREGAAALVDWCLAYDGDDPEIAASCAELAANRHEAEQIVASVLGLC